MLFKACYNVSAEAFAAEDVSTRINVGDRIHGHLLHTYTAFEQALSGPGELGALYRESAIFVVISVLPTHGIHKTTGGHLDTGDGPRESIVVWSRIVTIKFDPFEVPLNLILSMWRYPCSALSRQSLARLLGSADQR